MKTIAILFMVGLGSFLVEGGITNLIGSMLILAGGLCGGYIDGKKDGRRDLLIDKSRFWWK